MEGSHKRKKTTDGHDKPWNQSELEGERENLEEERTRLEELKKSIVGVNEASTGKIKLNVGGTYFTTSRTTLLREPHSVLASIVSGRWKAPEDDGVYFIDRDPEIFSYVLDYLRNGSISRDVPPGMEEALQRDASFFCLEGLISLLGSDEEEERKKKPKLGSRHELEVRLVPTVTWKLHHYSQVDREQLSAPFLAGGKQW